MADAKKAGAVLAYAAGFMAQEIGITEKVILLDPPAIDQGLAALHRF